MINDPNLNTFENRSIFIARVTQLMSFMVQDEQLITLDEALAFIDFCEDGAALDDARACAMVQDINEPLLLQDIDDLLDASIKTSALISSSTAKYSRSSTEMQTPSPVKKKRVRKVSSSSTVLQRRKKAEIETLREEAMKLKGHIAQIKRTGGQRNNFDAIGNGGEYSSWHQEALMHRKPNTLETRVNGTLPVRGSAFHFYKLHFLRKFEEKNRVIIVWSDLLQMTSRNLRLRSIAHAVFTPSERDPLNASVMHTRLKLYIESPTGEGEVSPAEIRHAQEVVLRGMGRLMRKFWKSEQTRMLELTSRPPAVTTVA
ncbi:unnamed protein product [Phytophthora lilii]|uniref:Unnamed protein product n=1 Tax=Phytophthora lilii TaxID=2077276 RepID=A0A9W6TN52_9STRA|nr:unnamed protein product [Phytophthora lilii]